MVFIKRLREIDQNIPRFNLVREGGDDLASPPLPRLFLARPPGDGPENL